MNFQSLLGRTALVLAALGLAGCSSSPMRMIPVDVEPPSFGVTVFLHDQLGGLAFDPVLASRTPAAKLLEIQCRVTNDSDEAAAGIYVVEFLDGSGRRVSTSSELKFSMYPGGMFVMEARATSASADQAILTIRP